LAFTPHPTKHGLPNAYWSNFSDVLRQKAIEAGQLRP
jgi:hypothetical protein